GNVNITKDNRLGLMDLGMVARFDNPTQDAILKLMIGLGDNDGEQVTETLLSISTYDADKVDTDAFQKKVSRQIQENEHSKAKDLKTGRAILDIDRKSTRLNSSHVS